MSVSLLEQFSPRHLGKYLAVVSRCVIWTRTLDTCMNKRSTTEKLLIWKESVLCQWWTEHGPVYIFITRPKHIFVTIWINQRTELQIKRPKTKWESDQVQAVNLLWTYCPRSIVYTDKVKCFTALSPSFHISFNSLPQNNEIESGEREPGELP